MKKLVLVLISFIALSSFSQGNLQFNQVKLISAQETVPSGKVWKVESALFAGGAPFQVTTYTQGSMSYLTNGTTCIIANSINGASSTNNNSPVSENAFPFWLPAGSTLASGTNMRYLSVIEFNIVP